jgi:sec-independent protein translocase protein TatC
MPLAEHLRELRNRLFKSMLAILVVTIVSALYYNQLIAFLVDPVLKSVGCHASLNDIAQQTSSDKQCAHITMNGLLTPFTLALKVSLMAGVVLATPIWLYQLWAFLAPGLHSAEKKYALSFVGAGWTTTWTSSHAWWWSSASPSSCHCCWCCSTSPGSSAGRRCSAGGAA